MSPLHGVRRGREDGRGHSGGTGKDVRRDHGRRATISELLICHQPGRTGQPVRLCNSRDLGDPRGAHIGNVDIGDIGGVTGVAWPVNLARR